MSTAHRMHFHAQNLTDGRLPMWRHGRAWWGRWHAEWSVFYSPRFHVGIEKGGYEDNHICFRMACGLFSVYLSRAFPRYFDHRELDIAFHDGSVWIHPWIADDHSFDKRRPWYRRMIVLHVKDWIVGRAKCTTEHGEPFDVLVPMPEGCYRAKATPERRTWRYRFGYTITRDSHWLEITDRGGIPFSGKGENSWDCGDDGLCGIGGEGKVERAIGNAVASALESRRRYGSTAVVRNARVVMARPSNDEGQVPQ